MIGLVYPMIHNTAQMLDKRAEYSFIYLTYGTGRVCVRINKV